jgi:hypothetical protein
MIICPQFGHGNFVASVPGGIILLHDVQVGMFIFLVSLTPLTQQTF